MTGKVAGPCAVWVDWEVISPVLTSRSFISYYHKAETSVYYTSNPCHMHPLWGWNRWRYRACPNPLQLQLRSRPGTSHCSSAPGPRHHCSISTSSRTDRPSRRICAVLNNFYFCLSFSHLGKTTIKVKNVPLRHQGYSWSQMSSSTRNQIWETGFTVERDD